MSDIYFSIYLFPRTFRWLTMNPQDSQNHNLSQSTFASGTFHPMPPIPPAKKVARSDGLSQAGPTAFPTPVT